MGETNVMMTFLRNVADEHIAEAIADLVTNGSDRALCRINPLAFAARHGFDEEKTIAAFLQASALGLFEFSWNVLCPGCGGVLDTNASLKTVVNEEYICTLCAAGYEPTLDELVEVTFTVSPGVRHIAGHDPNGLPFEEYLRQIYWSSGINLPEEGYEEVLQEIVMDVVEIGPGERGVISLHLPEALIVVFEVVSHSVQFINVTGEPTSARQSLSLVYGQDHVHSQILEMQPGPLRLTVENLSDNRAMPAVMIAGDTLRGLMGSRRPFLTANRLLTNQTFRDLHRTDTLDIDQRLKITSLTFLFTDLRGSTELYERIGDLAAFDLVRTHFRVLQDIVASEGGAVVKTIGDAVMATFATPDRALAAAMRMRRAMDDLNRESGRQDLLLKIGVHEGSCIAVSMNERQDYFGQTVNIASRVQALAGPQVIFVTGTVVEDPKAGRMLTDQQLTPERQHVSLRGIDREIPVFAII